MHIKNKSLIFMLLAVIYSYSYAIPMSTVMALAAASSASHSAAMNNLKSHKKFFMRSYNFDYMYICAVDYKKIEKNDYIYFCPNPPEHDKILFMDSIFDSDEWPSKIIYYMKKTNTVG